LTQYQLKSTLDKLKEQISSTSFHYNGTQEDLRNSQQVALRREDEIHNLELAGKDKEVLLRQLMDELEIVVA